MRPVDNAEQEGWLRTQEGFLTEQQIIDQCEGENPFDDLDEYFGGNES
jgi:hypothetical protein